MAGRSREREAALTQWSSRVTQGAFGLATDQGQLKRNGSGAQAPHTGEGKHHEEVKAQEGQVGSKGHIQLWTGDTADFHEDEDPVVDNGAVRTT